MYEENFQDDNPADSPVILEKTAVESGLEA
jgi:hypothetical protein